MTNGGGDNNDVPWGDGEAPVADLAKSYVKEPGRVRLTDRDLSLIRWINGFGFVEAVHIERLWRVDSSRVRHRVVKLVRAGVLSHDRIFVGLPGVYRATATGVAVAGDDLPPARINLQTYHHDRKLISLALHLSESLGVDFLPDRRVRRELAMAGVGQKGHAPDGVIMVEGKRTAIELELTPKGADRRKRILDGYKTTTAYKQVWYYAAKEVAAGLRAFVGKPAYSFLRVEELPDGL